MRDDLKFAAYAVALGFTLEIDSGKRPFVPSSFIAGIPHDGLSFVKGPVHVWDTARGWRVAKLNDEGRFTPPLPEEFFKSLRAALDTGATIAGNAATFTVFCQDADGGGTIWIDGVEADNKESAIEQGRAACAEDWGFDVDNVHCLGLAAGDVKILQWDDLEA